MPNDPRLPLDQQLNARRTAAARKHEFARALQKHADGMRREAEKEMQEIEIAERVLRDLPETESQAMALEQSVDPNSLWQEAKKAASAETSARRQQLRNEAMHELATRTEPATLRQFVTDVAMHLLRDGSWKTTEELHLRMDAMGVPLGRVQNPVQRVSQILSQDERFKNQRGRGWSLATDEDRKDEWDQKLQHRTKELLDKDNSAR